MTQGVKLRFGCKEWMTDEPKTCVVVSEPFSRLSATVSRIGRMKSCTCCHCHCCGPPLPPPHHHHHHPLTTTTTTPAAWHENVMDGWGTRPLRWWSIRVWSGRPALSQRPLWVPVPSSVFNPYSFAVRSYTPGGTQQKGLRPQSPHASKRQCAMLQYRPSCAVKPHC